MLFDKLIEFIYQVHSILHGLRDNAYQLGLLLTRLLPEVSKLLKDPITSIEGNDSQDSPGRYYAKAFKSHKQFYDMATDKSALEAAENYNKVCLLYAIITTFICCFNIPAMTLIWKFVPLVY
jgi:hypothetical protein